MKKIVAILMILLINTTAVVYAQTIVPSVNITAETNNHKIGELEYAEYLHWTGKEYIFHDGYYGGYKKSVDFVDWEKIKIDKSTSVNDEDFNYNSCKFIFCDDRYIALSFYFDEELSDWIYMRDLDNNNKLKLDSPTFSSLHFSIMCVLNENFKVLGEAKIEGEITAFSYVDNKFYVRTQDFVTNYEHEKDYQYLDDGMGNVYVVGASYVPVVDEEHGQPINKVYVSDDGLNWILDETRQEVPLSNNGRNIISFEKGLLKYNKSDDVCYTLSDMSVGNNLDNMKKVVFEKQPLHIEHEKTSDKAYKVANELYVSYQMNNKECFEVSLDGVYWFQIEYPQIESDESLVEYHHLGNKILFRTDRRLFEYNTDEIKQIIIDKCSVETPFVQIDNKILGFEVPPITESDRTLVPMRFLFEQMGAEVTWDNDTQTATATVAADSGTTDGIQTYGLARGKSITFGIDDTTAVVNGDNAEMDVPARLVDGKTMVPLRFLSENLGYNVEWDENTNTAIVTTK